MTTSCTDYASRLTSTSTTGTAVYNSHGDAASISGQSFTDTTPPSPIIVGTTSLDRTGITAARTGTPARSPSETHPS